MNRSRRNGISAIVVVLLTVVMLCFAFMALNMANIQRHHASTQTASDLASRWGVDMLSRTSNRRRVERQVRDLVHRNCTVAQNKRGWLQRNRRNIQVDVALGTATPNGDAFTFHANRRPLNSVSVETSSRIGVAGFLSRPRTTIGVQKSSTSMALERDVCVVVDRSGSMNFDLRTDTWSRDNRRHSYNPLSNSTHSYYRSRAYQFWHYWADPEYSRWSAMVPALYGLADELNKTKQKELFSIVSYSTDFNIYAWDHRMGVARYSGTASTVEHPPSNDYVGAVRSFDTRYKYQQPIAGGTSISAGIDRAVEVLTSATSRPNAFKTIILMTDGQHNQGRDPAIAAADAAAQHIEIFTVTFGDGADQSSMIEVAEKANGQHFHAPNGKQLEEIFRGIANIPPNAWIQ